MPQDMPVSSEVKYNKIVMLVHPFYNLVTAFGNLGQIPPRKIWGDKFRVQLKIYLRIYGKALLEYSRDPNICFVIVKPNLYLNYYNPAERQRTYDILFARLEKFMRRLLKERVFITDYVLPDVQEYLNNSKDHALVNNGHLEIKPDPILSDELTQKLSREVSIESLGEYGGECVENWRKYMEEYLKEQKIKVVSSRANKKYSLNNHDWFPKYIKTDCIDISLLKQARERRRQRKKFARGYKGPRLPL